MDPDWQTFTQTANTDLALLQTGAAPVDVPAGSAGDHLVVFVLCNNNYANQIPELTAVKQLEGPGFDDSGHDLIIDFAYEQPDGDGSVFAAHGPRTADLAAIMLTFSPSSGALALAWGNFPPGTYAEVASVEYDDVLTADLDVPGSWVLAGLVVADDEPPLSITSTGAGVFDATSTLSASNLYMMRAFAYQGSGASFDLETPGPEALVYAHVLGRSLSQWRIGRIGWPRS